MLPSEHAPPTTTKSKELATKIEILGIRPASSSSTRKTQYFVHYINTDKRLDKWIGGQYIGDLHLKNLNKVNRASSRRGTLTSNHHNNSNLNDHGSTDGHFNSGSSSSSGGSGGHGRSSRSPIRSVHAHGHHDPKTKVRNVSTVQFGKYNIDTWYYSPYPNPYGAMVETLYICEFTFKYMLKKSTLHKHVSLLKERKPPGRQIYDDPNRKIAVFEMIGREHRVYCQNLCLFAKLFIEHKTLYYDADPFLFYVLTEYEKDSATNKEIHHPVGYYSKEIHSAEDYNLACILTYPPFQRNGYGRFLMSLSYEISKREKKLGSPEKPLSDLGKLSYRSYWQYVILKYLFDNQNTSSGQLTLDQLCNQTAIKPEDAISTLQHMSMVRQWKGQLVLYFTREEIDERLNKYTSRNYGSKVCIDQYLSWTLPEGGYDMSKETEVDEESNDGMHRASIDGNEAIESNSNNSDTCSKLGNDGPEPPQKKVKH